MVVPPKLFPEAGSIDSYLDEADSHLRHGRYILALRNSLGVIIEIERNSRANNIAVKRAYEIVHESSEQLAAEAQKNNNIHMAQAYSLIGIYLDMHKPSS